MLSRRQGGLMMAATGAAGILVLSLMYVGFLGHAPLHPHGPALALLYLGFIALGIARWVGNAREGCAVASRETEHPRAP